MLLFCGKYLKIINLDVIDMTDGELIKFFRKKNKLTQDKLAQGICSIPYLSKVENNALKPSAEILSCLCKRLNINYDDLKSMNSKIIIEKILNWDDLIKNNALMEAQEEKQNICTDFDTSTSPYIQNLYQLVNLHLDVKLKKTIDRAILDMLEDNYDFLDYKQQYFFTRIKAYFSFQQKKWNDTIDFFLEAIRLGANMGESDTEHYYVLSIAQSRVGLYVESNQNIKLCEMTYLKNLNYKKVIKCKVIESINYYLMKNYELAQINFENLLSNNKLDNSIKLIIMHNLALTYYRKEQYTLSKQVIYQSIDQRTQAKSLIKAYYLLALNYFKENRIEDVKTYIKRAKKIMVKNKNLEYLYKFKILEKKITAKMNVEWEVELKTEIIPFFESYGDKDDLVVALKELADLYYFRKKYKLSSDLYKKLFEISL